jgi:pimeloyl-ACP methyl ester carboxylesterase
MRNEEENTMIRSILRGLCLLAVWLSAYTGAQAGACREAGLGNRELTEDSYHINSDTEAVQLYMRNKRPADMKRFQAERTLLYVHGATYPAETTFDLALGGFSWMDYLACRGYDVYLVDLRGYGRSTRPPEMDKPAEAGKPIVRTDMAVRDVASAVDHVLARRGVKKLDLLGWSWGTTIMGTYASTRPARVHKLVLYAPGWLPKTSSLIATTGVLGTYRTVTMDAAKKRWLTGVPQDKQFNLIPEGWFEKWAEATWATDPTAAQSGALRAPNGVLQDLREYWSIGKPSYDPAGIRAPTLLVHGDWDQDTPGYMAQALLEQLKNAPRKRLVVIPEATHTVIMERNRMQLFKAVQAFLDKD